MTTALPLLTHSRMDTFKTCRKRHWFAYERAVRPVIDAKALRMGQGFHGAQEILLATGDFPAAVESIRAHYRHMPDEYDVYWWSIECETVIREICGYVWRWSQQNIEVVATEQEFALPLINPETGQPSRTFMLAGKIDGIIKLSDGRLNILEHKLLSEDLGTDSDLWKRLRIDHQITLYVWAARQLGFPVDGVTYNVARKPGITATAVPILDENGVKVVVDQHGERIKNNPDATVPILDENGLKIILDEKGERVKGKGDTWRQTADKAKGHRIHSRPMTDAECSWRQTADIEKGYVLLTRPMTPEEWGNKLAADIVERPDYYFVRQEIPRLDADVNEFMAEVWDIAKTIRDAQLHDRHYRTCNKNTCAWCPYFNICTENTPLDQLPEGFEVVANIHPELPELENTHGYSSPAPAATAGSPAETTAAAGEGAAAPAASVP